MSTIEKSIEINAPVREAYNQWTKFEEFHRFMDGVQEVHQLDGKRLHWKAEIGGQEKYSEVEIIEQNTGPLYRMDQSKRRHQWGVRDVPATLGDQIKSQGVCRI